MERRSLANQIKTDKPSKLYGYAASFNTPTQIKDFTGRSFTEIIHPEAFTRTLQEQPDIRMLRDHNPQTILGRTKANTLRVGVDNYGLWFECDLPETQEARDLVESIKRGDLDSCSFGFSVNEDAWSNVNDMPTRELRDVTLYECSVVAFPAYESGTSVDLRSLKLQTSKPNKILRAKLRLREIF